LPGGGSQGEIAGRKTWIATEDWKVAGVLHYVQDDTSNTNQDDTSNTTKMTPQTQPR
jgi:hypothetical protein